MRATAFAARMGGGSDQRGRGGHVLQLGAVGLCGFDLCNRGKGTLEPFRIAQNADLFTWDLSNEDMQLLSGMHHWTSHAVHRATAHDPYHAKEAVHPGL